MHLQKQCDTRPTRRFLLQRIHQEAQPRLSRSQTETEVTGFSRGKAWEFADLYDRKHMAHPKSQRLF